VKAVLGNRLARIERSFFGLDVGIRHGRLVRLDPDAQVALVVMAHDVVCGVRRFERRSQGIRSATSG
jgi:hypothetical protein